MKDYISIFKVSKTNHNQEEMLKGAMSCMDKFAECFEKEDIAGMDGCCHFPHYLISGNEIICWKEQGQLTKKFFEDLKKHGFAKTVVDYREIILIRENKVHLKYGYSRISVDGNIMSKHDNVWILTYKDNKWGIQVRSY
jgi:hypothetical protein